MVVGCMRGLIIWRSLDWNINFVDILLGVLGEHKAYTRLDPSGSYETKRSAGVSSGAYSIFPRVRSPE